MVCGAAAALTSNPRPLAHSTAETCGCGSVSSQTSGGTGTWKCTVMLLPLTSALVGCKGCQSWPSTTRSKYTCPNFSPSRSYSCALRWMCDGSPAYESWYFGPTQTMSPGWSTPARHCCTAETETCPVPLGTAFCCDTSMGIRLVCPVNGGRS